MFALRVLTWMFLCGLAGSAVVAVLFIFELLRVTMTKEAAMENHRAVEG